MFNTRFDNGYQNTNDPNMNMDANGYRTMPQDPYAVYNTQDPYSASYNPESPMMQNIPYPVPPAEMNAGLAPQNYNPIGFANGGGVKKKQKSMQNKPYFMLAEMIRQQGKGEDTILAHINPLEAMMLKSMGGSGTINPKTGLPQFGLFSNPGKWFKSVVGPAAGVVLGNMLLPGLGGVLGGALGGAAGSKVRGRKDAGAAALRGLGMGAAAPTLAGLAGSGLSSLGASGAGSTLTDYGNNNAIMTSLNRLLGTGGGSSSELAATAPLPALLSANKGSRLSATAGYGDQEDYRISKKGKKSEESFFDRLLGNTGDYLSKPKNLLTLGSTAASLLNRPKKDTPESRAAEQKRFEKALMLSPAERAAKEADLLAEAKMHRSIARNKFLPEERLGNLDPLYRKSHTPEEQKRYGKWFSYYNNPNLSGEPLPFKEGGLIEGMMSGGTPFESSYIDGIGGGQDDNLRTRLPDNSYIIDASTISDLGDGNSRAGADKIDALISNGEFYISPEDVARFGKLGAQKLNSFVKNVRKHKGGSVKLPPKAKPLSSYLK
jgi:hypothetical protein